MKKTYRYCVYDLVIGSEIEIPQLDKLLLKNKPIDVMIEIGDLPEMTEQVIIQNGYSKISKHEYICQIEDIVSFYVGYGSRVVMHINKIEEMEVVYLFLLGHILGVVFAQRELVALHSSSIVINDGAFLICGYSGAGKTTTSTILTHRGYKLLADDISVVRVDENDKKLRTYRGFPQQKFCPDVVEQLKINTEGMQHITYQKEKYHATTLENFSYKATLLKGIFEIRKTEGDTLSIKKLLGRDKLCAIINHIFLREVKYFIGGTSKYMNEIVKIAKEVPYFIIERPAVGFTGNEIADYIVDYANRK